MRRILLSLATAAWLAASPAGPAVAAPSPAARDAAARGAGWLAAGQQPSGAVPGGAWGLTALAAGGLHAADVVTPGGTSAQDERFAALAGGGLAGLTNFERELLGAHSGGIDPTRVGPQVNLLSAIADAFDGRQLGGASIASEDVFGLLALEAGNAPQPLIDAVAAELELRRNPDGGWHWGGSAASDPDTTGAGAAAICGAGRTLPLSTRTYLRAQLDESTGGFPTGSPNSDSTGWIVSGLNACGEDAAGAGWATATGKTPIAFLLGQQRADGGFRWRPQDVAANPMATVDATRALAGAAFSPPPPERPGGAPAWRTPPTVAGGSPVKTTLVIDHGDGVPVGPPQRVRACEAVAPLGAPLVSVLDAAPDDCVTQWSSGPGGTVASVNGVAAMDAGGLRRAWTVEQRDRDPTLVTTGATVAFGDVVLLRYGPPPGGDDEAPEAALALPPEVSEPSVETRVDASDGVSAREDLDLRYRVDGAGLDWEPYAERRRLALPETEGPHDVCVEARDEAGNVSAPSCARTVYRRPAASGVVAPDPAGDAAPAPAPVPPPDPATPAAATAPARAPALAGVRLRLVRRLHRRTVLEGRGATLGAPLGARVIVSATHRRGTRCHDATRSARRIPCRRARWLPARGLARWQLRTTLGHLAPGGRLLARVRLVLGRRTLDEKRVRL